MSGKRIAFAPRTLALGVMAATVLLAIALALLARGSGEPVRGYTGAGLLAGIVALLAMLAAGAYSWRKRAGQEHSRGALSSWLAWHLVFSALALVAVWLHSGAHLDGRTGTMTAVLLALVLGSGVFGLVRYLRVPGQVLRDVGNLAPGSLELEIRRLQQARDLLLSQAEQGDTAHRVSAIDAEIGARRDTLARQRGYRRKLRAWLWLHVPASIAVVLALGWHVGATWRTAFPAPAAARTVFESSQDCRGCHPRQFQEWSGSMHAMAMQSPLTDIQNRLVLALESEQLQSGALAQPIVGDLCVRCHAPSAYLGDPATHEPIAAPLAARARLTAEGITCTVCHRMPQAHACASAEQASGQTFRACEGGSGEDQERQFYNANNLVFEAGRGYYGPLGANGDAPPVGNAFHRGLLSGHAGADLDARSRECASCHTVQVHDPADGKLLVRLQDTYQEWKDGGTLQWKDQFACADCHNASLPQSDQQVQQWQAQRTCLAQRVADIRPVMAAEFGALPLRSSAEPPDAFDRPLPLRTRLNHHFAGVDRHLEAELSGPNYPAFEGVAVPREQHDAEGDRLLRLGAAIRIEDISDGRVQLQVANLATGHSLPAGFAFARELWVEVAVSPSASGEDFTVLVGGRDGRPLRDGELLDKQQPGLRNFQKVLFDSRSGEEVVLQNQADSVLAGKPANDAGFPDRVQALKPGELRALEVNLSGLADLSQVQRVRVRLRFRSLPPEFLEKMAVIAERRGLDADAARLRAMVGGLRIVEVAQDERPLSGGRDCP